MSTLLAARSIERLQGLQRGVSDRGSALSLNWRAEVVPRADGRLMDVYYYSPSGARFRSDLEVYRHLGLPVRAEPRASADTKKRSPSTLDGGKGALSDQHKDNEAKDHQQPAQATDSTSGPELIPTFNNTDLPEALREIPITCNSKLATWHVALNKVECRDNNCSICGAKPASDRFMTRSGVHGFAKHAGLTANSHLWRSTFKINLPGLQGMSVDKYFQQHNCSLAAICQSGVYTTQKCLSAHKASAPTKSAAPTKTAKAAKRHKPLTAANGEGNTSKDKHGPSSTDQIASEVDISNNLRSIQASGSGTSDACHDTSLLCALAAVAEPNAQSGSMSHVKQAAMTAAHAAEIASLQAKHAAEVKALKAQIAQGQVEHQEAVKEIGRLSSKLYDVKTGSMLPG